jgi:hypothetical protein
MRRCVVSGTLHRRAAAITVGGSLKCSLSARERPLANGQKAKGASLSICGFGGKRSDVGAQQDIQASSEIKDSLCELKRFKEGTRIARITRISPGSIDSGGVIGSIFRNGLSNEL